jgi:hypothetical protein
MFLSHVCGVATIILLDREWSRMVWVERTMNSYSLLVKRENESRHPIFWSLGTLTGLRVRVRGLIT